MVGEKLRRILSLGLRFELFEKLRHGSGVVSRIVENLGAHDVGLRFGRSRIAQQHTARREIAQRRQERTPSGVSENCAEDSQPGLRQHRFGGLVGAMAQSDVRQFMGHHSSELGLIVRSFDRATVYEYISSGQRKSIDGFIIHAMKFERILHAARGQLLRQTRTQLCQVSIDFRCVAKRQLLFRICGRSLAKGDVLLWRKLIPARFERSSLRRHAWNQKQRQAKEEHCRHCVTCFGHPHSLPSLPTESFPLRLTDAHVNLRKDL